MFRNSNPSSPWPVAPWPPRYDRARSAATHAGGPPVVVVAEPVEEAVPVATVVVDDAAAVVPERLELVVELPQEPRLAATVAPTAIAIKRFIA